MTKARDYKHEAAIESPKRKAARRQRKRARYAMEKAGKVSRNDGKTVEHKKTIKSGGTNSRSNLTTKSMSANSRQGGKIGNRAGKAAGGRKSRRT